MNQGANPVLLLKSSFKNVNSPLSPPLWRTINNSTNTCFEPAHLKMDMKDVSQEKRIAAVMEDVQRSVEMAKRSVEMAKRRKGQLVRDHQPKAFVVSRFMANRREPGASLDPSMTLFSTSQVPAPYPPSTLPLNKLEPIMISDMRLETHHRGRKTFLHVLTPPSRITAVMAIVEDECGDAITLQLYHQPEESVVPAREVLMSGVCVIKEPYFKCAMDGTYSVRIDHVSDIVWLDPSDDRVPQKWRRTKLTWSANSVDMRKQGNDAVESEKWAEAERL